MHSLKVFFAMSLAISDHLTLLFSLVILRSGRVGGEGKCVLRQDVCLLFSYVRSFISELWVLLSVYHG